MKDFGFIAFFLFISVFTYSQKIVIKNITTGEPVENVAVFNKDKSKSTLSDENGILDLSIFEPSDTLIFQHTSYLRYDLSYQQAVAEKIVLLEKRIIILPEFVISASKFKEDQRDVANMVDVISPQKLFLIPSQTSAEILSSTGNVFVQKSQGGGGSPVLRGFEANKVLLVIDGVRMNNAIYRGGHLQNAITIDNLILERTEIIYGPTSVIYGSDALGGVIHYITRDPELSDGSEGLKVSAGGSAQASSANLGWRTHLDFNLGTQKFASLSSATVSDYGNIRTGSRRLPYIGDWGKDFYFVERISNIDSMVANPDHRIQKNTGYSQYDFLQKFRYRPVSNLDFVLNLQYSTSSDIPRYDQLNDWDDDHLKYAEWYYGPQNRFLSSLKSAIEADHGIFSTFNGIISFQDIDERRNSRKYRKEDLIQQNENVTVIGLNLDFIKNFSNDQYINYGFEGVVNNVKSEAFSENILTGQKIPALTRYPDKGSYTTSYSVYFAYKKRLFTKLITSVGLRYNYSTLLGNYGEIYDFLGFNKIKQQTSSLTGALSFIYQHSASSKINLVLSTGFRNPNLDDVAKVRPKSGKITLPNGDVKPEYTYNLEAGLSKTFDGYIQINGSYFITLITDVIVRLPYTLLSGADSMLYDGDYYTTYANGNSNRGVIHGFSINMLSDLNSNLSFRSTLNYTWGRDITNDLPLAHIPPIYGKTNVTYSIKKFINELYICYSGWKTFEDMVTTGEDNDDEASDYGFPGWYTLNLRTSYELNKYITLQLAVENLTNNFYKPFASGVSAPGMNFIATIKVKV